MAIRYPLASVLRVRIVREEHEERLLQEILQESARAHSLLHSLDAERLRVAELRVDGVMLTVGRNLHLSVRDLDDLQRWKCEMEEQVRRLDQLKEQQVAYYQSARRDREVLSELLSRQRLRYMVEAVRREHSSIDDYFVARQRRS